MLSRAALALLLLLMTGCANQLAEQPKLTRPLEESPAFGRAARDLVPHTVARGELREDEALYRGEAGGEPVTEFPLEVTTALVERGQEQYDIFCAPCHGLLGEGDGTVVQRGFPAPPTFHSARLREAPVGHFFHVITHGQGTMFSYAARLPVADRWAVIAYIRALQLSQGVAPEELSPEERSQLPTGEEEP